MTNRSFAKAAPAATVLLLALAPSASFACACGCGVFDVGSLALISDMQQPSAFVEYNFMDQNRNWSGTGRAPASDNEDVEIRSHFVTLGAHTTIADGWSVMAELPVVDRVFKTDDGAGVETFEHTSLGDMRLMGAYSGFFDGMATSAIFGVKLPTGDFNIAGFDRDTAIGGGSTDLLLGLSHTGLLSDDFGWYGQIMWDKPLLTQGSYTPGTELNGAVGIYYDGLSLGGVKIVPMLQAIASNRTRDGGANATPDDTGYNRILLSPGIEVDFRNWRLSGDIEFPVYQDVNGNQLAADRLFKFIASYRFGA